MNNKVSLQELVALNNTPKAKALIVKYGYKPANSFNDLIFKLTQFTKEHREDALKELAEIHPHKDLILNFTQLQTDEIKSNCEGDKLCSKCKASNQFIGFDGTNNLMDNQNTLNSSLKTNKDIKNMLPIIAITSLLTASLVILISKSK
jgi:hypothetical protein